MSLPPADYDLLPRAPFGGPTSAACRSLIGDLA